MERVSQGRADRILIVEDASLIAMSMEAALLVAGHDVVGCAPNPERAFAIAAEARPDLALVDVMLGEGSEAALGVPLARRLHAELGVPSLFVTANPGVLDRTCGYGVVAKPFSLPFLVAAVEAALRLIRADHMPDITPRGFRLWRPLHR